MKTIKFVLALTAIALSSISFVNAQTEKAQEPEVVIPESYQETQKPAATDVPPSDENVNIPDSYQSAQEQLEPETSGGTSTYNIDENVPPADPSAAEWRNDGEVEELRVYSGSHDGNNYVKTVSVKIPARSQFSSEYTPK